MQWIFVRNAVKCGEIFIFTAFTAVTAILTKIHRISYKNLPKNLDPGGQTEQMLATLGQTEQTPGQTGQSETLGQTELTQNWTDFGWLRPDRIDFGNSGSEQEDLRKTQYHDDSNL